VTQEGLGLAGRAGVDGTVDVVLRARDVMAVEHREVEAVRVRAGYRALDRVPLRLPLVTDAVLHVRGALPAGGGCLPGGVEVAWRGDIHRAVSVSDLVEMSGRGRPVGGAGWIVPAGDRETLADRVAPVVLEVIGRPFALRPGGEGRLVDVRRRARIASWASDGWCGMRMRFPVVDAWPPWPRALEEWEERSIPEEPLVGPWLEIALEPGPDGLLLGVAGRLGGEPDDPVAFDPGDGAVEIVRQNEMRLDVEDLALGGGGVVARGAGLELKVRRPDRKPGFGPHRWVRVRRDGRETTLRLGVRGRLHAGGRTHMPTSIGIYSSNHAMGEAYTTFEVVRDGTTVALEPSGPAPRIDLEIVGETAWRACPVRTRLTPTRPGESLRSTILERPVTRRVFLVEPGRGLRAASPAGGPLAFEIEAGGDL
jgi:hypothetical protein